MAESISNSAISPVVNVFEMGYQSFAIVNGARHATASRNYVENTNCWMAQCRVP